MKKNKRKEAVKKAIINVIGFLIAISFFTSLVLQIIVKYVEKYSY